MLKRTAEGMKNKPTEATESANVTTHVAPTTHQTND
jgi:hypothetical protein